MIELDGRFWLTKDGKPFLGEGRVELLKKIDKLGSISAASKEMKMSYKAAWDALNQMGLVSKYPILEKQTGGKGGGGTNLTAYGHELVETFENLSKLHKGFINKFKEAGDSPKKLQTILNRTFLTTSARNQLLGEVEEIQSDNTLSNITIKIDKEITLSSRITTQSLLDMGIGIGSAVYAIIKSSDIVIKRGNEAASNELKGAVISKKDSNKSCEVQIKVGSIVLVCVADKESIKEIKPGDIVTLCIKSDDVLIGI